MPNKSNISNFNEQNVTVLGFVSAEPDVRSDGVRYIVRVEGILDCRDFRGRDKEEHFGDVAKAQVPECSSSSHISGKIYLKSELYPRYNYGDQLTITCNLKTPEPIEDFRYDMYLARYGVFSICQFPRIEKTGKIKGNVFLRKILYFKTIVAKRVNILWHEPYASFMAGLLYGYRGGLGNLNESFSRTGVTHIVAISGYNITIISSILLSFCIHLCIPRKKAFWIIILGILVFVIFAGLSASVVRAGIMGGLVLFAKYLGRSSGVFLVMIVTAVLMTINNPFIFVWDVGFQLSFLASFGLVYLSPIIDYYLKGVPKNLGLRESLGSTLAAIIATLPLTLYQFKSLSLIAPVANILILWIIPYIMLFGFISVIFSFIYYPIALIFAWISWFGLAYIVYMITFLGKFYWASVKFAQITWQFVVILLVVIFICYLLWKRKQKNCI